MRCPDCGAQLVVLMEEAFGTVRVCIECDKQYDEYYK